MRTTKLASAIIIASSLIAATHAQSAPVSVDYNVATTGQSARATFDFLTASTLQISLFETTPLGASALTGGDAILTNLGFLLPRGQIIGGSVLVGPGSTTVGFAGGELGAGANVSNLWGYTPTTLPAALQQSSAELAGAAAAQLQIAADQDAVGDAKRARAKAERDAAAQLLANNPDAQMRQDAADLIKAAEQDEADAAIAEAAEKDATQQAAALQSQADQFAARALIAPAVQLVGVLQNPLTPFLASPPAGLFDGLAGGLIGDTLARGITPVIGNSVLLSLTLSDALSDAERASFLDGLSSRSSIGYGTSGLLGGQPNVPPPVTVPEPSMASFATAALLVLSLLVGRRRKPVH